MFSDQKRQPASKRKGATAGDSAVTILTRGCHFEGKLYCKGASRIGGRIQGQVVSEGLLIIEEEAKIKAEMVVDEVIVLGQISGKLRATKRIELCESARFQGEITTPSLVIKEGAQMDGKTMMAEMKKTEISTATPTSDDRTEPELDPRADQQRDGKIPDVTIVNSG